MFFGCFAHAHTHTFDQRYACIVTYICIYAPAQQHRAILAICAHISAPVQNVARMQMRKLSFSHVHTCI